MAMKILDDIASIILAGQFNLAIFQPHWFAARGLLPDGEADAAKIGVVHPEIAQFETGWLNLQVNRTRFLALTSNPACRPLLRDLVRGTFQLLEHTPTTALGLARAFHIDMVDDEHWHALGHKLAPKEPWASVVQKPGLRSLLMQCERADGRPGKVFVRVEPSQKYREADQRSAFVEVTDEYILPKEKEAEGTRHFLDVIDAEWEPAGKRALDLVGALVRPVLEGEG